MNRGDIARADVASVVAALDGAPRPEGEIRQRTGLGVSRVRMALSYAEAARLVERVTRQRAGDGKLRFLWARREVRIG